MNLNFLTIHSNHRWQWIIELNKVCIDLPLNYFMWQTNCIYSHFYRVKKNSSETGIGFYSSEKTPEVR